MYFCSILGPGIEEDARLLVFHLLVLWNRYAGGHSLNHMWALWGFFCTVRAQYHDICRGIISQVGTILEGEVSVQMTPKFFSLKMPYFQ